MEEVVKKVPFSVRLPEYLVERLRTDAQKVGLGTSDWVTSLLDEPNPEKISNESFDRENTSLRSEIESLRAEIRACLPVLSAPAPPDLSPVLSAIGNLSSRNVSAPPVDLSPLSQRLEEILDLLRTARPSGETESEAHALSFLSLQLGEIQQGIERLSVQIEGAVRAGRNNGGGPSPEIKDELIRLSEAAEHQSALTGEILRIGDAVREIRERLQKNPTTGEEPVEKVPEKVFRKETRPEELDPASEKKRETRQWGWATGIILVLFFGFITWEMVGWYNGGDSAGVSPGPSKSPGSSLLPGPKKSH